MPINRSELDIFGRALGEKCLNFIVPKGLGQQCFAPTAGDMMGKCES